SPAVAGIFSLPWKIFRGADVASTKIVTAGGAADQLEIEKNKMKNGRQTTPKILESFIFMAPMVREKLFLAALRILDYSSPCERRYSGAPALLSSPACRGGESSSHSRGSTVRVRAHSCASLRRLCGRLDIKFSRHASRGERRPGRKSAACCSIQ